MSTHADSSDGPITHSLCILCFRSLVGEVHSRLKSSSVGAGSGDDQLAKNYLAAIQNDVKSLLSKSKV